MALLRAVSRVTSMPTSIPNYNWCQSCGICFTGYNGYTSSSNWKGKQEALLQQNQVFKAPDSYIVSQMIEEYKVTIPFSNIFSHFGVTKQDIKCLLLSFRFAVRQTFSPLEEAKLTIPPISSLYAQLS